MRRTFSNYIEKLAAKDKSIIFLTGDLGFNAFENLREKMGERFINMGVAEQNMVSVAAGMASKGFKVFCYSIAPFIVYRPLEQIRNDVCFHNLPVFLVGNGGGYGYGIMGSSHHALEDLASLAGLPNMQCYIPAFKKDVELQIDKIILRNQPAYLRLGLGIEKPVKRNDISVFDQVLKSENAKVTVAAIGPVIDNVLKSDQDKHIDLFVINQLPFDALNNEFLSSLDKTRNLLVIEEHIKQGGLGQHISIAIHEKMISLDNFQHLHAKGYPSSTYGSQKFHQKESGLDTENISKVIQQMI